MNGHGLTVRNLSCDILLKEKVCETNTSILQKQKQKIRRVRLRVRHSFVKCLKAKTV